MAKLWTSWSQISSSGWFFIHFAVSSSPINIITIGTNIEEFEKINLCSNLFSLLLDTWSNDETIHTELSSSGCDSQSAVHEGSGRAGPWEVLATATDQIRPPLWTTTIVLNDPISMVRICETDINSMFWITELGPSQELPTWTNKLCCYVLFEEWGRTFWGRRPYHRVRRLLPEGPAPLDIGAIEDDARPDQRSTVQLFEMSWIVFQREKLHVHTFPASLC